MEQITHIIQQTPTHEEQVATDVSVTDHTVSLGFGRGKSEELNRVLESLTSHRRTEEKDNQRVRAESKAVDLQHV